jgi:signal transduction histidine kinase
VRYSVPLVAYVAVVFAIAIAVALLTVRAQSDTTTLIYGAVVIFLLTLVTVRTFGGASAPWSPAAFVHLAVTFAAGPVGALLAAVFATAGSFLRLRTGWFRALLNFACYFLVNVAAYGAFHSLTNTLGHSLWIVALAGVVAGFVSYVVNCVVLSGVISISSGTAPWTFLRSTVTVMPFDLAYGLGAAGFGTFAKVGGAAYLTMWLAPVVSIQGFLILLAVRTNAANAERERHARERVELLQWGIAAEDNARFETASNLHDGPVAHLSGLAFELDATGHGKVADELRAVQRELRTQIYALSPHDLDKPGRLREEVTRQLGMLRERGVDISVEIPDAVPLDRAALELAHRVCGEALTNVLRHANAQHVNVVIAVQDAEVVLMIDDDGCGFSADDVARQRAAGHFGTRFLAEKAELAHGSFRLESEPGTGSHVRLSLPTAATAGEPAS